MGLGGVTQLVHHLHAGIHGRIKADGILTAGNIVVNGPRNADTGQPTTGQILSAAEGAVATDDHHAVDPHFPTVGDGLLHALLRAEFRAAGRIQHGTAAVDDIRNTAQIHGLDIPIDQAVISTVNAKRLHALAQGRAHHGTNGGIHAGGIPSAGQNCNFTYRHSDPLLIWDGTGSESVPLVILLRGPPAVIGRSIQDLGPKMIIL